MMKSKSSANVARNIGAQNRVRSSYGLRARDISPPNAHKPVGLETTDFNNNANLGEQVKSQGGDRNSRQYANLMQKKFEKPQVSPDRNGPAGQMQVMKQEMLLSS